MRRKTAWARLEEDPSALETLVAAGTGDLGRLENGQTSSNHARLLALACSLSAGFDSDSKRLFELALDLLVQAPHDDIATKAMMRPLTQLIVVSQIRGSDRILPFTLHLARSALHALLELSSETIEGRFVHPIAQFLAGPYLIDIPLSDPFNTVFTKPYQSASDRTDPIPPQLLYLSQALDDTVSSTTLTSTASDILALIAPSLLHSIQTAPAPPLGIPSTYTPTRLELGAGSFAGKVYSQHEFRNRGGVMPMGLGAGKGVSRPASRHVDEWSR